MKFYELNMNQVDYIPIYNAFANSAILSQLIRLQLHSQQFKFDTGLN